MKPFSLVAGLAFASVVGAAAPLAAQTCQGYTPFSVAPLRVTGDLTLGDHATAYGASLSAGQSKPGLFGGVAVAGTKYDGVDDSGKSLALFGGLSVPVTTMSGLEFCPVASYTHGWLPSIGTADISENDFSIGGALGRTLVATPTLNVVPFGDLRLVHTSVSFAGSSGSDNFGLLAFGAGFVFSKKVTLRPEILIPIAQDGSSSAFAISFGYNFGGK